MPENQPETPPPVSCRVCRLGHYTIYGATMLRAPDTVNMLRREVRTLPPQRTIFREGEVQTHVYTLYSGWAFSFSTLRDGRRQIIHFFIPGDVISLEILYFPKITLPFAVRSLTTVTLCSFDAAEAAVLLRANRVQEEQAIAVSQRFLADNCRHLADIGKRSAMGRVAQLLLELESRLRFRKLSFKGAFEFPIRQEHLADALGLTTVYVNRTMDRLRKLGVIAFDRHHMTILDPERLREIAEEE
jgi:CRP/FNR family transcriptional regulator, anaerobic regulatory protein